MSQMRKAIISICGVDLDIDYQFHPAYPGHYEKGGMQISPDEPAFNEIHDVRIAGTGISIWGLIDELNGIDTIEAQLALETDDESENENE